MEITRKFEIDIGHRLMKHEGKCKNYHGHRLVIEVGVSGEVNVSTGMIEDFGSIKKRVGEWLEEWWDHGMILQKGDPLIPFLKEHQMKHYVVPFPPSVEFLAAHLRAVLPGNVSRVKVYETPSCWAESR